MADVRTSPLLTRLQRAADLGSADIDQVRALEAHGAYVGKGVHLVEQGKPFPNPGIVSDGWALRFRLFDDGRRQIVEILPPGTFYGLESMVVGTADYTVSTATPSRIVTFEPTRFAQACHQAPGLASAILWSTMTENALMAEHLVSVGRRTAIERVAHLMVEMWYRLSLRGLCEGPNFILPLTQEDLADTLGLSIVHVNRVLRGLQKDGVLRVARSSVRLDAPEQLKEIAGFDPAYLHHGDYQPHADLIPGVGAET